MITDCDTNIVLGSKLLGKTDKSFCSQLESFLKKNSVRFEYLEFTKDIWCRDYMPVQISEKRFIQFRYEPPYLKEKKYQSIKTNPDPVCAVIKINTVKSKIILDGGNVVKSQNKVLITDRIFSDNNEIPKVKLINELSELFETENVIIIPRQPNDLLGHSDGMIRFLDDDNVLVNDFSSEKKYFNDNLFSVLKKHNLQQTEFIYSPSLEKNSDGVPSAKGTYINYLHVGDFIVMPSFNMPSDEKAYEQLSSLYPKTKIEVLDCNSIASEGGVLNCITWNIYENQVQE